MAKLTVPASADAKSLPAPLVLAGWLPLPVRAQSTVLVPVRLPSRSTRKVKLPAPSATGDSAATEKPSSSLSSVPTADVVPTP